LLLLLFLWLSLLTTAPTAVTRTAPMAGTRTFFYKITSITTRFFYEPLWYLYVRLRFKTDVVSLDLHNVTRIDIGTSFCYNISFNRRYMSFLYSASSINKSLTQIISQVTFIITQYSDLALDRNTTLCFLFFHNICPKYTQKPVVDHLLTMILPN